MIVDVYKAHSTPDVIEMFKASHCLVEFVPANCTSELQVMDLAVNKLFKDKLTNHFVEWYATQVFESLQEGGEGNVHETAKNFTPDRLSVLKPIHAKWVVSVFMDLAPLRDTFHQWLEEGSHTFEKAS